MKYESLKVYDGAKEKCDNCDRMFRPGEVITLSGDLVFCYSDAEGMCLQEYLMFKMKVPQMLVGGPVVYRQKLDPQNVQASASRPTILQRIGRFFDLGLRK